MAPKAPNEMTAGEALEAYGFKVEGDVYYKDTADTQTWERVTGGFRRLERPAAGIVIGAPAWGRPVENTGLIEVPYRQAAKFEGVSGLHPATHPEAFEWIWPEEAVAEIYAYGYTPDYGRRWKRNADGELVQDRSPQNAGDKDED